MIGQVQLQAKIQQMLASYPRFTIITGASGSGKKTIANSICQSLGLKVVSFGTSIDEVRKVIERSYDVSEPTCFLGADADGMSLGAKNALLKITEEPPRKAYFILTLEDMSNTLETIKSRGVVLELDPYTEEELVQYRQAKGYSDQHDAILKTVCRTTGEVDRLYSCDVLAFHTTANSIATQISKATCGNALKIHKLMKIKESDKGYDPILLFTAIRQIYIDKAKSSGDTRYLWASNLTTECINDLKMSAVSKVGSIDNWMFGVRVVLGGVE